MVNSDTEPSRSAARGHAGDHWFPLGAVFSPRGDSIAAYGVGRATLWDLTGHKIYTYAAKDTSLIPVVSDAAFHPREHVLAVATGGGIDLWDTDSHRSVGRLEGVKLKLLTRI